MKVFWLVCLLLAASTAPAQDVREMEKRITAFTLANGMRFVILERHQAPVVSFHTYVGGGSVDDPAGQSGLAYLLGRMAFKGSESIGSRNWPQEKKALDALDQARERMDAERNKGVGMNQERYDTLRTQWRLAVDAALRQGDPAAYTKILAENGATGARSRADWNAIQLSYTLPSNRLELWFAMESQRLMHPVLREFDKERTALIEERTKALANPQTRIIEAMLSAAFTAHPYRVPLGGWPSDLPELQRSAANAFLEAHFVPGNIVIGMAGDVDPAEAKRLAAKYFDAMPARPMPPLLHTTEPPQIGPRTVSLELPTQVICAIGYKRPDYYDKDDTPLDVLLGILGAGKGGMVWRQLVEEKKLAIALQVGATYPDGHYPNLFAFLIAPAPGHTVDDIQKALDEILGSLRSRKVGPGVLNDAITGTQAVVYQRLASNATFAEMLAIYTFAYGDWRKLFSSTDDIAKVTEDDILRVAQRYFTPSNRTTAYTVIPGAAPPAPRSGGLP